MANNGSYQSSSIKWLSDGHSISELQVKTVKCSHTWTIKNFSFCFKKHGEWLDSPIFSDKPDSNLKWYLTMFPMEEDHQTDFISVCLCLESTDIIPVFTKFEISLINSNKKFVEKKSMEHLFEKVNTANGWSDFIGRNILFSEENGLLPDDELTIHCEVNASFDSVYVSNPESHFVVNKRELPLAKNLASLLKSGDFSDVTLRIQDTKFRAHQAILAANSVVFSAMFEHDMKEKRNNHVNVEDLDSEAIEIMLRFMYTAETPVLDLEKAKGVLIASDMYAIDSLKSICEEYLVSNQTVETAAELLYLADLHNAHELKRYSLNFIRDHAAEVLETPFWKKLSSLQPKLLLEAFEKLALC